MNESSFNPWLEIWTEPRATINRIVNIDQTPNRGIWILAAIFGIWSLLIPVLVHLLAKEIIPYPHLILTAIVSPIWGFVGFSIWSFVVFISGKIFGGQGTFKGIRAASAWSCLPLIFNVIGLLVLIGLVLFTGFMQNPTNAEVGVILLVGVVRMAMALWSSVIFVNALSQIQGISVLRAIGNTIVAMMIFGIFFYLLLAFAAHASGVAFVPSFDMLRVL